jgi:hypothetical protein
METIEQLKDDLSSYPSMTQEKEDKVIKFIEDFYCSKEHYGTSYLEGFNLLEKRYNGYKIYKLISVCETEAKCENINKLIELKSGQIVYTDFLNVTLKSKRDKIIFDIKQKELKEKKALEDKNKKALEDIDTIKKKFQEIKDDINKINDNIKSFEKLIE